MIIKIFHILRITKDKVCTFLKCISIGLPYDSSWIIHGKLILSRPNLFHDRGEIRIGKNFHAQAKISYNTYGIIQPNLLKLTPYAKIFIGNNVGISGSVISATKQISIGNNVLIGSGCIICDSDAHPIHPHERNNNNLTKSSPIEIEDDVFIGARCIILKGVRIGYGSVIGAGSVVTKNIPPMSIYAGNPAVLIKKWKIISI